MADINITVIIPDAHTETVKTAIEHYLKARGEIVAPLTNPQALSALKKLCSDRVLEIVRVYKEDTKRAVANAEASAEVGAIQLS